MQTIVIIVIILILYQLFFNPKLHVLFLENKINTLRPAIVGYLSRQQETWEETLRKFRGDDPIIKIVHQDENTIQSTIAEIKKDLEIDNKYQLLKQKLFRNPKSQVMLASNYLQYLECLDSFRKTSNLNILGSGSEGVLINVGYKKQRICQVFEELESYVQP